MFQLLLHPGVRPNVWITVGWLANPTHVCKGSSSLWDDHCLRDSTIGV